MGPHDAGGDARRRRTRSPRRRPAVRRLSPQTEHDALKLTCPACGAAQSRVAHNRGGAVPCPVCTGRKSRVTKSEGVATRNEIRRRRECLACGERFPTGERLKLRLYTLEVEARERGLLAAHEFVPPPPTWASVEALLEELRDDTRNGEYHDPTWAAFAAVLAALKAAP